jgi:hypothetical protein
MQSPDDVGSGSSVPAEPDLLQSLCAHVIMGCARRGVYPVGRQDDELAVWAKIDGAGLDAPRRRILGILVPFKTMIFVDRRRDIDHPGHANMVRTRLVEPLRGYGFTRWSTKQKYVRW